MLENLSGTEAELSVPDQQFGDEVFGTWGDVGPFLLRELVLPLLDALKQSVLEGRKDYRVTKSPMATFSSHFNHSLISQRRQLL